MKIALFGLASGASGGIMLINWTTPRTKVL